MTEIPQDLPIFERDVVRIVLHDAADRILLFHTHEITAPELGQWWELPGGGIDEGETYLETALRELREETGISISPEQVGAPTWRRTASFRHRDRRHLQHEVVVAVRLDHKGEAVDGAGRFDYEREDYFDYRWWPIADVVASSEQFYPRSLPQLLTRFLAGHEIDEPFELWS
ncbi:NUDIX domain-containing protein [Micromonospora sp. NPDC051196]|uniref:NUDIX hydrolase n=1 Tax=Micromonospora sp. NPDC051196 TaxID=3155281 RepID=UPI0034330255